MPTAPHTLSPELDDHLMSMLAGDSTTLKACALVCKAWLAASRVYLFRNIIFQTASAPEHFEEVVHTSPMVRDCVKCFTCIQLPVQTRVSVHTFSVFIAVTRLEMYRCHLPRETLFGIVCSFPALKELVVSACNFPRGQDLVRDMHSIRPIHTPILSRLVYRGCPDVLLSENGELEDLIGFLLRRGCVESLRAFDIGITKDVSLQHVGEVLRRTGAHLVDLRIIVRDMSHFNDPSLLLPHIDFATNTHLRRIMLTDHRHPTSCPLLSRVVSPHLRTVRFTDHPMVIDPVWQSTYYADVERTMAAPNLSSVVEVQVQVREHQLASYADAFPELRRRQILRVACDF